MMRVTERIGWGATLSTTFQASCHLARTLGSLDLLSKGRACWNVVTSATEMEALFGLDGLPPKNERYDRGDEVLPSIAVMVGETDSIAREKSDDLDALANPELVLAGRRRRCCPNRATRASKDRPTGWRSLPGRRG